MSTKLNEFVILSTLLLLFWVRVNWHWRTHAFIRKVFCVLYSVIVDCCVLWCRDHCPGGCPRNPSVQTSSRDPRLPRRADGTDGALLGRYPWRQTDVWNDQKHYKVHQKVSLQIAHCYTKFPGGNVHRFCVCMAFWRQLHGIMTEDRLSLLTLCVIFLRHTTLPWWPWFYLWDSVAIHTWD